MQEIFVVFLSSTFLTCSILGHLSLLQLKIKTRRHSSSSAFCSFKSYNSKTFMSSAVCFCACYSTTHKRLQKCLMQKVVYFGFLGWIPMIQAPFNSSYAALQYETGIKFFHRAVPKLRAVKTI